MKNQVLTIVIPTFNRKPQLAILLRQIKSQKLSTALNVVVVVDGSNDGTYALLESEFPEVSVVKGSGNWWFTKSLNEGCKYAVNILNTDLVLTLNDDVEIPDFYLDHMLKNYQESGSDCIIGSSSYSMSEPRMITFSGIKKQNKILLKYYKYIPSFTYMEPGKLSGLSKSVTLPTRGLLVSAGVLKKLNYFDEEKFPQYASDYDFVLRAAKKKVNVFVSYDAYVFEHMQLTSSGNPRLSKSLKSYLQNLFQNKYSSGYFFNRMNMAWRHGIKVLFPAYLAVILMTIPYTYMKYKYVLNKKLSSKN